MTEFELKRLFIFLSFSGFYVHFLIGHNTTITLFQLSETSETEVKILLALILDTRHANGSKDLLWFISIPSLFCVIFFLP